MGKLNDRQREFCKEYVVDLNATQAAIRAKYSKKTAYSQAHDLLKKPEIQEHLTELRDALSAETGITAKRVLEEYAAIAFTKTGTIHEGITVTAKTKVSALGDIGKHLGLFEKDNAQKGSPGAIADLFRKIVEDGDG